MSCYRWLDFSLRFHIIYIIRDTEARNQETLRPNPAALMSRQRRTGQGRDEDDDDESGDGSDQEVGSFLHTFN